MWTTFGYSQPSGGKWAYRQHAEASTFSKMKYTWKWPFLVDVVSDPGLPGHAVRQRNHAICCCQANGQISMWIWNFFTLVAWIFMTSYESSAGLDIKASLGVGERMTFFGFWVWLWRTAPLTCQKYRQERGAPAELTPLPRPWWKGWPWSWCHYPLAFGCPGLPLTGPEGWALS